MELEVAAGSGSLRALQPLSHLPEMENALRRRGILQEMPKSSVVMHAQRRGPRRGTLSISQVVFCCNTPCSLPTYLIKSWLSIRVSEPRSWPAPRACPTPCPSPRLVSPPSGGPFAVVDGLQNSNKPPFSILIPRTTEEYLRVEKARTGDEPFPFFLGKVHAK